MASGDVDLTFRSMARKALQAGRKGRGAAGKTYRPASSAQQRKLQNQMTYDKERNRNRY